MWYARHGRTKIIDHGCDDGRNIVQALLQQGAFLFELAIPALGGYPLNDLHRKITKRTALILDDLAEEQILALDRCRALVQGVDLGIPHILFNRIVGQEA